MMTLPQKSLFYICGQCTGFIGAVSSDIIHVFAKRVVEMHVLIIGITKG
jgi:hypothetical protein